jgi:hypothetical protein
MACAMAHTFLRTLLPAYTSAEGCVPSSDSMAAGRGGASALRLRLRPRPAAAAASSLWCGCVAGGLPGMAELEDCSPLAAHLASMALDAASIRARKLVGTPQVKCNRAELKAAGAPARTERGWPGNQQPCCDRLHHTSGRLGHLNLSDCSK